MKIHLVVSGTINDGEILLDFKCHADLFFGVAFTKVFWCGYNEVPVYALLISPRKRKPGALGKRQRALLVACYEDAVAVAKGHVKVLGFLPFQAFNRTRKIYEERWIYSEDIENALSIRQAFKDEGILV